MNGTEPITVLQEPLVMAATDKIVRLTSAQEKQLLRLVSVLGRATERQKAAQEALDLAQASANDFIVYCAEEAGIQLGSEWTFDQARMSFVRQAQEA